MNIAQQKNWINLGKFIAITAVIVDHSPALHTTPYVQLLSFFSVSLFILLSGITSYYSCERHFSENKLKEIFRRLCTTLVPYVIATAIYQFINNKIFDFSIFWYNIFNFNASPPFYFILFYIQLIIISPFLFDLIRLINSKKHPLLIHSFLIFFGGGGEYFIN